MDEIDSIKLNFDRDACIFWILLVYRKNTTQKMKYAKTENISEFIIIIIVMNDFTKKISNDPQKR